MPHSHGAMQRWEPRRSLIAHSLRVGPHPDWDQDRNRYSAFRYSRASPFDIDCSQIKV